MTYTFRIDRNTFTKGVANAKKFGGVYNATRKTWTITLNRFKTPGNLLDQPYLYGLQLVTTAVAVTHDHNCAARLGGTCECEG